MKKLIQTRKSRCLLLEGVDFRYWSKARRYTLVITHLMILSVNGLTGKTAQNELAERGKEYIELLIEFLGPRQKESCTTAL